jgi:hypothetical protein
LRVPAPDDSLARWFREAAPLWHDAVLPTYSGGSIANLVPFVLDGFDVPASMRPTLLPALDAALLPLDVVRGARVVMLVVIDGLGRHNLDEAVARGDMPGLERPQRTATLTSVFPPTTAAATTSLQYGVAPGSHGMAGYTLFFQEIQRVVNMITWRVAGPDYDPAEPPDPRGMLELPHAFSVLGRAGIDTVIVSNTWFEQSPLTIAQANGVRYRGYRTLAEFTHRLMREARRQGKRFVFGYWDGFDALGHSWGSDSDVSRLELRLIDRALREGLFEPLAAAGEDVALLITADHGHTPTPRDVRRNLAEVPGLLGNLAHRPTGEPRQLGLRFKSDRERWRAAMRATWQEQAVVLDAGDARAAGLYGPGPHHRDLASRIGDTLLLARDETAFNFPGGNSGSLGGHGSLSAAEMLVPLLFWRYGGG